MSLKGSITKKKQLNETDLNKPKNIIIMERISKTIERTCAMAEGVRTYLMHVEDRKLTAKDRKVIINHVMCENFTQFRTGLMDKEKAKKLTSQITKILEW